MGHEDIAGLLGAYALDAVDDDERGLVDEHLLACPRCRAELAEHREVAATLAHTGATAPEGVWERIVDSLEEPPPPMRVELRPVGRPAGQPAGEPAGWPVEHGHAMPAGTPASGPVWGTGPATAADAYDDDVVVLPRRRQVALRMVAAAAALLSFALIGGLVVHITNQNDQIDAVRQEVSLADQALDALSQSGSRSTLLHSPDDAMQVRAVISEDGDGFIFADELPALDDEVYQLWGVTPGRTVSLGVLGADPELKSFSSYEGVTALMITVEDAPGVEESDNEPALFGSLS